ncbi:hypothetical protein FHS89_000212 [Rubricella aquisinus]|uniref:Uncharacterized protein n=1 Tax=Rubricella aquisinus TaxID=2028108 RepID=A0A840WVE8_9RHOB|nr:hypothetical protein [Rubricella aquisinus]MBB5514214.1 hypothetical protein [Rubricella aquisinus]
MNAVSSLSGDRLGLRAQIISDMAAYFQLRRDGCDTLAASYRERAESLKPALRVFTNRSLAAANDAQAAEGELRGLNVLAPTMIELQRQQNRSSGTGGDGNFDDGTCVRQCRDGTSVTGVMTRQGQCFFEATCPNG